MPRSDEVHVALEQTSSVLNYLRTKLGVTSEVSVMSHCERDFWATFILAGRLLCRQHGSSLVVLRSSENVSLAKSCASAKKVASCQLGHEVEARLPFCRSNPTHTAHTRSLTTPCSLLIRRLLSSRPCSSRCATAQKRSIPWQPWHHSSLCCVPLLCRALSSWSPCTPYSLLSTTTCSSAPTLGTIVPARLSMHWRTSSTP